MKMFIFALNLNFFLSRGLPSPSTISYLVGINSSKFNMNFFMDTAVLFIMTILVTRASALYHDRNNNKSNHLVPSCQAAAVEGQSYTFQSTLERVPFAVKWQFVRNAHTPSNTKTSFQCKIPPNRLSEENAVLDLNSVVCKKHTKNHGIHYDMKLETTNTPNEIVVSLTFNPVSEKVHETKWVLYVDNIKISTCFLQVTRFCHHRAIQLKSFDLKVIDHDPPIIHKFEWLLGPERRHILQCGFDPKHGKGRRSLSFSVEGFQCVNDEHLDWFYSGEIRNVSDDDEEDENAHYDYEASLHINQILKRQHENIWSWLVDGTFKGDCFLRVTPHGTLNREVNRASSSLKARGSVDYGFGILLVVSLLVYLWIC